MNTLLGAIAALPKVIDLLDRAVNYFAAEIKKAKIRKSLVDLEKASIHSKTFKDTSRLEQLFDPTKQA